MEAFALTVLGLIALAGWFMFVATTASLTKRLNIYKSINLRLRNDLDIAQRDLRHCRAELGIPKPFGDVKEVEYRGSTAKRPPIIGRRLG